MRLVCRGADLQSLWFPEAFEAEQPGIAFTRSQAVRVLLLEAIRARKAQQS